MEQRPRIIVSMTSYPARIKNVPLSVFALVKYQTLPPDEIHLWLSTEQFPNKEADLPKELLLEARDSLVMIHWLEKNTYVHKRHEIFKTVNNGCVFLIDDDVIYDSKLIETVMAVHAKHPNVIVCYNRYDKHRYKGRHIRYGEACKSSGPFVNTYRWCGQSMIPASMYPKEVLSDEMQEIRNTSSPISDECWMQPWLVYHDIPIFYLEFGWGTDITKDTGKSSGLVSWSHQKDADGYERRDRWLAAVLDAIPKLKEKYENLFGYDR